jgi:hypothetical protein
MKYGMKDEKRKTVRMRSATQEDAGRKLCDMRVASAELRHGG